MRTICEVAVTLGVSVQTIARWYKFKQNNPDSELAKKLPDYSLVPNRRGTGRVRVWTENDIWKLVEFKTNIKSGRGGKMGKYGGKGTDGKNKKSRRSEETK